VVVEGVGTLGFAAFSAFSRLPQPQKPTYPEFTLNIRFESRFEGFFIRFQNQEHLHPWYQTQPDDLEF
jgi:hypothetical protein